MDMECVEVERKRAGREMVRKKGKRRLTILFGSAVAENWLADNSSGHTFSLIIINKICVALRVSATVLMLCF